MPGPLDYLVPPPMPGLLQSGAGQPFYPSAPNWGEQRDPFVFGGAPRPPPAGDVVLPTARPGFADTMPRIPRSIHRNDARLFGGDFIPAAWQGGPGNGLADLPEAVRRSIAEQPSYGEGERMPGPPNPLMEQEHTAGAFFGPQREDQLVRGLDDIRRLRSMGNAGQPVPEGEWLTTLPEGLPLFAPGLDPRLQRRGPFALY